MLMKIAGCKTGLSLGMTDFREGIVSALCLLLIFIRESVSPPPYYMGMLPQTCQWESSCFFLFIFVEGSTPGISSQHLTDIIPYLE